MYQVVNMENLRSGELYVFSDNEFSNPPSYAVVSGWAYDGISLSVLMTESPLPEPSMRIDWDCRLPHGLSYSRLPTDAECDGFSACSKYAIVSRNWSSVAIRRSLRDTVSSFSASCDFGGIGRLLRFVRIAAQDFLIFAASGSLCSRPGHGRTVAVEANVAAVGREIGGRQKGPAVPVRFIAVASSSRGEGLAQMPRFDSGAIDRAALGNGIAFFYIGRVSDGQIGL